MFQFIQKTIQTSATIYRQDYAAHVTLIFFFLLNLCFTITACTQKGLQNNLKNIKDISYTFYSFNLMIFKPVPWHRSCIPSWGFKYATWQTQHQARFCGRAASKLLGNTPKSATNQLSQTVRKCAGLLKLFSWANIKLSRVHLRVGMLQGLLHKHAPVIGNKFFAFSLSLRILCTGLWLYKYSRDLGLGGWVKE